MMAERGFLPDFSAEALDQLAKMQEVHGETGSAAKDLRNLPWASIDNDDSLDLDQLTVAESLPDNAVRIRVAVADVDILVKKDTAIDEHARQNTTSIYTAGKTFPMLPERLSTGLTSLNFQEDRPAIVIDMVVDGAGEIQSPDIYLAVVHNYAKLAYSSVGAWLEGTGPVPDAITAVTALADNLRIQDRVAQTLKARRHEHGALDLQTLEARPVFEGDVIKDLQAEAKTRATELIEDFMIAANDVTARFLGDKQVPSLRRVVRVPKRWDRIVEIAAQLNYQLPAEPDSKALNLFLTAQKAANPVAFPTCHSLLSSCWDQANTSSSYPTRLCRATSASPSRTTRIPRPPTAGFPTLSPSVSLRLPWEGHLCHITRTSWWSWPHIVLKKKMMPKRWNGRLPNRQRPCSSLQE